MPLDLYRDLLSFYEEDRHFDDARAVVMAEEILLLSIDRRLNWLNFLDELAQLQAERCAVILASVGERPMLWSWVKAWMKRVSRRQSCDRVAAPIRRQPGHRVVR